MTRRPRRNHTPAFKAKVALAAIKGDRTLAQLAEQFDVHGSRLLRDLLAAEGSKIGRRHVTTLMKRMGIEALYRRPRTTKPEPGHKIYPYLLRDAAITRPNQVWAMDITYIPMARGYVYWRLCSTGSVGGFWRGASRSPWRRLSASRRWRRRW